MTASGSASGCPITGHSSPFGDNKLVLVLVHIGLVAAVAGGAYWVYKNQTDKKEGDK